MWLKMKKPDMPFQAPPQTMEPLQDPYELKDSREYDWDELRILKDRGFHGVTKPVMFRLPTTDPQTAAQWTTPFFIADRPYLLLKVTERHETAGSDAGAVTAMLKKVPSGTAPGSGTDMLTAGMSLKTTANTNQSGTVSKDITAIRMVAGDSLAFILTGTPTALVGVTIAVLLRAI